MQAPPADLPAAHSMDTDWFAIDGHGHVAVFDSGEGGGVPLAHSEVWPIYSMWSQLLDEMVRLAPPGGVRYAADGLFDDPERSYTDPRKLASAALSSALLELEASPAPELLERWWKTPQVFDGGRPLVYISHCDPHRLAAAWHELRIVRTRLGPPFDPERFGLYSYDSEDYSGSPYQRIATPIGPPLRVESLATGLRRRLGQVRMENANFSVDKAIQPFEHLPSTIWGSTWIGTDGSVHDFHY